MFVNTKSATCIHCDFLLEAACTKSETAGSGPRYQDRRELKLLVCDEPKDRIQYTTVNESRLRAREPVTWNLTP